MKPKKPTELEKNPALQKQDRAQAPTRTCRAKKLLDRASLRKAFLWSEILKRPDF